MKSKSLSPLLILVAWLASLSGLAHAQEFSTWSKLISFRPDAPIQEKLQTRPPGANGDRWKTLKIERARGNVFMHSVSLVVNKLPASEGKTMTSQALFRYVRTHLGELLDPTKVTFSIDSAEDKAPWTSDKPEGVVVKFSNKTAGTDYGFLAADVTSDHCTFTSIAGANAPSQSLVSGNVQINVTGASPMDGCIVQVRSAYRPTAAATLEDEWKVAEQFGQVWLNLIEGVRRFVEANNGDSAPALTPPTLASVAWNVVAKPLHQPSESWAGLEGTWQSTEKEQRFRIEFAGDSACDLIERNRQGKELRISLPVQLAADPKNGYVIERPNDREEVLEFYEFKPITRAGILEKKPEPSKLVLKRNSKGNLIGMWYNFTISRDASGSVKELKQASVSPARMYEFRPVAD